MKKKFVYQGGNNKKVILWCTANQISRLCFQSRNLVPLAGRGIFNFE